MTDTMCRILYCSRNLTSESGTQASPQLNQILSTARARNREDHITGALLFSHGYFAQVLEGPKKAIERTFERIQCDPRHGDITVLDVSEIPVRDFGMWSMARVAPASESQAAGAGTRLNEAFQEPGMASAAVLDLLRNLVIQAD